MIPIAIGFDQREAIAYHTFVQSVINKTTVPVAFTPLVLSAIPGYRETHSDGSNTFIYSRFLTPWLYNYNGWVIYADGDMVCLTDISELWAMRDESKAVMVVKHDYKTKSFEKYLGNKNIDYPRKNWSSVILWNCSHPKNKILIPEFVMKQTGAFLHRFTWLEDAEIGDLPKEWNWLATEYPDNHHAHLIHYTLGTPCFKEYAESNMSKLWYETYSLVTQGLES